MISVAKSAVRIGPKLSSLIGSPVQGQNKRSFWRMLAVVFNRPDRERIKEVGADRACAEWLMRCGAHIRWKGSEKWEKEYNTLPPVSFSRSYKIEEINAVDAELMEIGFDHFENVKNMQKIRLHHCAYLEDAAIERLVLLKDSLQHLEISSCGDVTDDGLLSLGRLTLLRSLLLYDLPAVQDGLGCYKALQKDLPECNIIYKDIETQGKSGG
ncbi:ATP synthase subunit s, mitochondrial [Lamellibrachia satsuma]|nr:ATP synthase subunit s, mitochondrial [Lamellibrachia satsuma]